MIDEYNIAMMALLGLQLQYEHSKDKEALYQDMKAFTDFCVKYDLLDNKNHGLYAAILRHAMCRLIAVTDLDEYAKERENNE